MPRLLDCHRLALLLVLMSALFSAQAAEVSPAERVETTPGLSPEAVRRAFDGQRQTLASCLRLVTLRPAAGAARGQPEYQLWSDVPGTDDRVQLRFTLTPEGKVRKEDGNAEFFGVRSLYLDTRCAESIVADWSFPTFPGEKNELVRVEVWARFRSTDSERKAALTHLREDYTALCGALSALGDADRPPSNEEWSAAVMRFLSERRARMDSRMRRGLETLAQVNVMNGIAIYENLMEERMATVVECPKLRSWTKKR
ncbi:hypothetical protein [Pyxidicoccus fallax]|uniref:hypothetical protein n=1 Tax=Pyxidicoccus fallax TaxID=394095 RepID=UPI001FE309B5|nr:hypothetical protein [Pyxidicoccus fallax]